MGEDIAKQVGRRVRELRTEQRLTLDELSGRCGMPPESLSRIERARTKADLLTLERLAQGLGVQITDLFGDHHVAPADIPTDVRAVALMLDGCSPDTLRRARQLLQVLLEAEASAVLLAEPPNATPRE